MNQEIKDYYENEWVHVDDPRGTRHVVFCNDVSKAVNNCDETEKYIRKIASSIKKKFLIISYVFPEETTIYYYEEDEDIMDKAYVFKATSIIYSLSENNSDYIARYGKFDNYKNEYNPLLENSNLEQVMFCNDRVSNNIYDTNKENFYNKVKAYKQKKIDELTSSMYNLKLIGIELQLSE